MATDQLVKLPFSDNISYMSGLSINSNVVSSPKQTQTIKSYENSKVVSFNIPKKISRQYDYEILRESNLDDFQITDLTDLTNGYSFLYPVPVKITRLHNDGIFIAECSTFNLYAQGETYEDSLNEIKSLLVDDYLAFSNDYPDGLTDDAISILRLYYALFGESLPCLIKFNETD
jgi:predicted RNase H-like HicB family nuclease